MRYPVYFFLLLTGFFYLTGKPIDDKTAEQLATSTSSKGQELAYARKTSVQPVANESTSQTFTVAGNEKSMIGRRAEVTQVLTKHAWEKNQPVIVANKLPTDVIRQAALAGETNLPEGKWRTSSLQQDQKPDPSAASRSFGNGVYNPARRVIKKPLDWTVFGNGRKRTSFTPSRRAPSRDEMDANRIPVEAIAERAKSRKYRKAKSKKRQLKPRKTARSSRKVKSRKLAQRKRALRKRESRKARSRKSKSRRYARLKRKNRGAYRVARRAKPRRSRKKYASYRPRRKKFGFSTSGGITSLGGL